MTHLEILVELGPPGLLDAVPGPQGLLGLGRPLKHNSVVHIAFVSLLYLKMDNDFIAQLWFL